MRTGADLGGVGAAKLVQHPRAGGGEPLLVPLAIDEVSLATFNLESAILEALSAAGSENRARCGRTNFRQYRVPRTPESLIDGLDTYIPRAILSACLW